MRKLRLRESQNSVIDKGDSLLRKSPSLLYSPFRSCSDVFSRYSVKI